MGTEVINWVKLHMVYCQRSEGQYHYHFWISPNC